MKKIIISSIMMLSLNVFANPVANVPTQYPTDSGWAVYMTEVACSVRFVGQVTGVSAKIKGGVLYSVLNSKGKVVAQATASNYSRFAQTECL